MGDTPLVSDRLSRRMEALFELLAAPPRSLFRLTVPDPNIALAALGGGRPWVDYLQNVLNVGDLKFGRELFDLLGLPNADTHD